MVAARHFHVMEIRLDTKYIVKRPCFGNGDDLVLTAMIIENRHGQGLGIAAYAVRLILGI